MKTYSCEMSEAVYGKLEKQLEYAEWYNPEENYYVVENPSDRLLTVLMLYCDWVEVVRDPMDESQVWQQGWQKYLEKIQEIREKNDGDDQGEC